MTRHLAGLALACAATACSGLKTYPNDAPKNLTVQSELAGAKASLHVYKVEPACKTEYLGTLALDRASVAVGLPSERTSYLSVTFDTSSFFGGSSRMSAGTLLEARAGRRYALRVSYREGIYDIALREIEEGKGPGRAIARRELSPCR